MPCLKIVDEKYNNLDALDILIHRYIFPKSKVIGGTTYLSCAAEHMKLVKAVWNKLNGKQLYHFILCFNAHETSQFISVMDLYYIGNDVCYYLGKDFQVIFGVHIGRNGCYHIHFVANSVSYRTGKRIPNSHAFDMQLRDYIQTCLLDFPRIPIYYK